MSIVHTPEDLQKMVAEHDERIVLENSKKDGFLRIMLKRTSEFDLEDTGKVCCSECTKIMSLSSGGHVRRHKEITCPGVKRQKRDNGEKVEVLDDPKQKKVTDFTEKRFTGSQLQQIRGSLVDYCLKTGRSFNHMCSPEMKALVISILNSHTPGFGFGAKAAEQLPTDKTIQKDVKSKCDEIVRKSIAELKPFASRLCLLLDHGKHIINYLSIFASYIDSNFTLKVMPIGFSPCLDGKSNYETSKIVMDKMIGLGFEKETVEKMNLTCDGALSGLDTYFGNYVRCVNHSLNLVAQRAVVPLDRHSEQFDDNEKELLIKISEISKDAHIVALAVRQNIEIKSKFSRLPSLPCETRWMSNLRAVSDIVELSAEISDNSEFLRKSSRKAFQRFSRSTIPASLLLVLGELLQHNDLFQTQKQVTLHLVSPLYRLLDRKWKKMETEDFSDAVEYDELAVKLLCKSSRIALSHYSTEFSDIHLAAVFLSPKTKRMSNFTFEETEKARSFIMKKLNSSDLPAMERTMEHTKSRWIGNDILAQIADAPIATSNHSELQRYLDEFVDPNNVEPVEKYWHRKIEEFPELYECAAGVFSCIPSESLCETSFSKMSFLLDKRRFKLSYDNVETVIIASQICE